MYLVDTRKEIQVASRILNFGTSISKQDGERCLTELPQQLRLKTYCAVGQCRNVIFSTDYITRL